MFKKNINHSSEVFARAELNGKSDYTKIHVKIFTSDLLEISISFLIMERVWISEEEGEARARRSDKKPITGQMARVPRWPSGASGRDRRSVPRWRDEDIFLSDLLARASQVKMVKYIRVPIGALKDILNVL